MLPTSEVFIITDLAGNDTTGFVKVSTLVLYRDYGQQVV
jgi:cell division control protein 24